MRPRVAWRFRGPGAFCATVSSFWRARLADLARGDLASLRAFLSGQGTHGTSLAAQLDARQTTITQDTLLTWAARHGQAEAVRLLLEGGASVGAADSGGATALLLASEEGHVDVVHLLLTEGGASVDQADENGETPLYAASWQGHLEVVRFLLTEGCLLYTSPSPRDA